MKHKAYVVLHLLFLGLVGANIVSAQTDAYPVRPITMIVPTAPGGTTDISARMLATPLGSALGQTIVVENKGGGNGNIAAAQVKRAPADGYMIMMQYSGYHVITPHVSKQQQWEQKDFQAVANVISAPQIIVIRAD
ncbi:MAG: tripartite tricarboxylate transporter substrate binding protein, partial [Burkholderiaceae bacterium]|nr:tripartite tricarboxylate transporter substrate binding protein [Burkholderiaceae bacterium]